MPEIVELTDLEKLLIKKEKLDRRIREVKSKESKAQRKKRTQKLIQIGGLAEIAGAGDLDKGVLLGGLISIVETLKKEPTLSQSWKQLGDSILQKREEERKGVKTQNE